jgi:hypothetical protein
VASIKKPFRPSEALKLAAQVLGVLNYQDSWTDGGRGGFRIFRDPEDFS